MFATAMVSALWGVAIAAFTVVGAFAVGTVIGRAIGRRVYPSPPAPTWTAHASVDVSRVAWVCAHGHVGVASRDVVSEVHCAATCTCEQRFVALASDVYPMLSADHDERCALWAPAIPAHGDQ